MPNKKHPVIKKGKRRSQQHIVNEQGERLLRSCLPSHWVLHDYKPDYGIDFSVETFAPVQSPKKKHRVYETLGEHIFIQLKTVEATKASPLTVYGRPNVEKGPEQLNMEDPTGELSTVRIQLEKEELVTVERMGVGVPVLLVIASLADNCCYFVCLSDYVDKILIPRFSNYAKSDSRTIHVPVLNKVEVAPPAIAALRWYAKRVKLYAAFQRFVFQAAELKYAAEDEGFYSLARYFAKRILAYDFWDDTPNWGVVEHYGKAVRRFLATGQSGLTTRSSSAPEHGLTEDRELSAWIRQQDVIRLWDLLALLSRNYEDVCREWYLPTGLGYMCSFSGRSHTGTIAQNIGVTRNIASPGSNVAGPAPGEPGD
jgi:hypothetical protein